MVMCHDSLLIWLPLAFFYCYIMGERAADLLHYGGLSLMAARQGRQAGP
jgi:hypothetical protein